MQKVTFSLVIALFILNSTLSQVTEDSLVRFSDLKFNSGFEKEALWHFTEDRKDTFNLFMAIDENMTREKALTSYRNYLDVFRELDRKKIESKKIDKQIKLAYSTVHSRFMKKYNSNEYFPVMFETGTYNCVSASMLFALVFDRLSIPYKVMASSNHVYLIADPGPKSIVVETTNPGFEKSVFTGEFKQQYVNNLRSSKMISEEEYKDKSVEEIFEEKFNEVRQAAFSNLPGFQYYNKAVACLQKNDINRGYELCQKAYYFFPDEQVKTLLHTILLYKIEKCRFDKVSDIDYLGQLSRFKNTEDALLSGVFNNIIANFLQYTDKESYCDSLYRRLIPQIADRKMQEEISFNYFLQMSYRYQNTEKVLGYVTKALKIKGNYHDTNVIMENYLNRKFVSIIDPVARLDTITRFEEKYSFAAVGQVYKTHKLLACLEIAQRAYQDRKPDMAEKYLSQFEELCDMPVKEFYLRSNIENTYHSAALYYFSRNNKVKLRDVIDRGLKYVPGSRLLMSARR